MNQAAQDRKKTFSDLMGVKIRVVYNHCVCRVEVDTDTTGTGGKQVHEIFRIWLIELIHALLSGGLFGFAVLENKVS